MFSFVILADALKWYMLQRKAKFYVNSDNTVKLGEDCRTLRKNWIHKTANRSRSVRINVGLSELIRMIIISMTLFEI